MGGVTRDMYFWTFHPLQLRFPPLVQYLCETLGKVAIAAEEFQGCIVCMQTTRAHAHMEGSHSQGFWLSLACLEDSNLNQSFRSSGLLA